MNKLTVEVPPRPIVSSSLATTVGSGVAAGTREAHRRRGKAPPVSEFTGKDPEYILGDWLPSLECAECLNRGGEADAVCWSPSWSYSC